MGFFFFQAEDGIRDYKVTGVQTCALPICFHLPPSAMVSWPPAIPNVLGEDRTTRQTPMEINRAPIRRIGETVSFRKQSANATLMTTSDEIAGSTKLKSALDRAAAKSTKKMP